MKTLKLKATTLGLVATLLLAITIQSCTQQELPIPTEEPVIEATALNVEPTTVQLAQDDPIIVALKASEDIKHYNSEAGELLWDMVSITTYNDEETLPVIIVPIDNGEENDILSMLTVAYDETDNNFLPFVNNINFSDVSDTGFSGTMEYRTVENSPLTKTIINEGVVVSHEEFEINEITYRGYDWACFQSCLRDFGVPSASVGLGPACIQAWQLCMYAPSPYNPACYATFGCAVYVVGSLGWCAYKC